MPFQNTIMPDVTPSDMRGVMGLLHLIGHPQSAKAAADLLTKLSAEKDAAVEAAKKSAADVEEFARHHREIKDHRNEIENRLAKTDADLRTKIDAHAKAVASLQQREDDLRVRQTQHASQVAVHYKEIEAVKASNEVRVKSLDDRESELKAWHEDLDYRQKEFDKQMAPVKAAAALARV